MHVIVGSGPIGTATATQLAAKGERVRMITRRGTGPKHADIELVAADATDAERLSELTKGAEVLYNCANPQYHRWLTDWPPLAASFLTAAERSGAVLAMVGNLYGYGPVESVIDENTPLAATHPKLMVRRRMFEDLAAAQAAGRVRFFEARGSDYVGYQVNGVLGDAVLSRTAKGKSVTLFGDLDAPHSWTNVHDVGRTLVTLARDERAWGRAWLVPTPAAISVRAAAKRANELIGAGPVKVSSAPYALLWTLGLFSPMMKELRATYYQFNAPFVIDSSATERTFGLTPTPLDETLREAALAYRNA